MKKLKRILFVSGLAVFFLAICVIGVSAENTTATTSQLVGGDRDAHGCIPSAGYSWCEAKQKCLRTWEEGCAVAPAISGISLHLVTANSGMIEWTPYGTSTQGFKVVWSKNRYPAYPTREGDQYHYLSDPKAVRDTVTAFAGPGTYYVRVCAYNNSGTCDVYSNQVAINLKREEAPAASEATVSQELTSISLQASADGNGVVEWTANGISSQGFKVVWSKTENPAYPTREGDKYHFYTDPAVKRDTVTDFAGAGTYYVRVCEYLGGKCGIYSNQVTVTLGDAANTETPVACTMDWVPVCGADGKTYGNKCTALAAKVAIKYAGECKIDVMAAVSSISLSLVSGNAIKWSVDGVSPQGFKVVWSKTENPTYPTREGDRYHYYSDRQAVKDVLQAFAGAGVYYVRVCEYLNGKCGVYSNQIQVNLNADPTKNSEGQAVSNAPVTSIVLTGEKNTVKWSVEGYSANGFKVVWSKTENPAYPTRDGDKYHYRGEPSARQDWLEPFSGNGTYYVRVCAYKSDGTCGLYSNQITVEIANAADAGVKQIAEIRDKAQELFQNKIDELLTQIKSLRDLIKEQQVQINHLTALKEGIYQAMSSAAETSIKNFITYGVDANTKNLGEGERAAVMYSYKAAFDKLPTTEEEMEDAIKIANGRWPSITNDEAEVQAKAQFKKIYLREADMNNAHDAAAVKVMAYGLRQQAKNRNLKSEASALKTFKAIFKKIPATTEDWNALQAITYSGATR